MSSNFVETVELDKVDQGWFNDTRSYRAAIYACRHYNRMVTQAKEGYSFYDTIGPVDMKLTVVYSPEFTVSLKDGENCWVSRIGSVRHEKSGKIVLSKKDVNEWLSGIRYVDPKHLKRIRLG